MKKIKRTDPVLKYEKRVKPSFSLYNENKFFGVFSMVR